jgi:hypothetical protein
VQEGQVKVDQDLGREDQGEIISKKGIVVVDQEVILIKGTRGVILPKKYLKNDKIIEIIIITYLFYHFFLPYFSFFLFLFFSNLSYSNTYQNLLYSG